MSVRGVSDLEIVALWQRRWVPEVGHLHGPTLWAIWDGRGARYGLQPGCHEPATEVLAADAEFGAFLMGLSLPSPAQLLAHGMAAFGRWLAAGLPVVSETERQARGAECVGCDLWDGAARAGLGMCRHRSCGCTSLKWWLKTERCPAGRWPA